MLLKHMKSWLPFAIPLITLSLDRLSKIWTDFFYQMANDVRSVFTFSRWLLMAVWGEIQNFLVFFLDNFNWSSATRCHFSNQSTIAFIFAQKILQHCRLYWWDGSVQIYSNSMQFWRVPTSTNPKETAFLVRIFHVFQLTCSKLEHWCY